MGFRRVFDKCDRPTLSKRPQEHGGRCSAGLCGFVVTFSADVGGEPPMIERAMTGAAMWNDSASFAVSGTMNTWRSRWL